MSLTTLDERTALVLIDLQIGATWMLGAEAMDPVVAGAVRLAEAFRERHLPVFLVRVDFHADGADRPRNRVTVERIAGRPPADWARIVTELGPTATDVVVTKRTTGAFHGTDLDLQLRRRGVTGVVIGGVTTSMGVEATARDAYDRGFNVTFAMDATTDTNAAAHRHSVENVFPNLGEVGTVSAVIGHLGQRNHREDHPVRHGGPDRHAVDPSPVNRSRAGSAAMRSPSPEPPTSWAGGSTACRSDPLRDVEWRQ